MIAFAFILSLSLMSFKKSSGSDVNTFIDKLRNAKNLEYEVTVYNKNSAANKYMKKFSSDTTIRQGQIQFDPQVFSEYVLSGYGTTNEDGRIAKAKRIFASADDLNSYARIYSPEPNKGYKGFTSPKENGWVWIDKDVSLLLRSAVAKTFLSYTRSMLTSLRRQKMITIYTLITVAMYLKTLNRWVKHSRHSQIIRYLNQVNSTLNR